MTEKYLHYLWSSKRLLQPDLVLTNGKPIKVIHFGFYNDNLEGPDFSAAVIEVEGETFFGPIEIHLRSSDWYRHGHHFDRNYNQVILHVVLHHDRDVMIADRTLPTLELEAHIDQMHVALFSKGLAINRNLACAIQVAGLMHHLEEMKETAIQLRLKDLRDRYEAGGKDPMMLVSRAFGLKTNGVAMGNYWTSHRGKEEQDPNLTTFRSKGARPANRSTIRIAQLRVLHEMANEDELFTIDRFKGLVQRANYQLRERDIPVITDQLLSGILINGVLPISYFEGFITLEGLFQSLKNISSERNAVLKEWTKLGVPITSAFDSQGLLWLYMKRCSHKKCLTCVVGKQLLTNDTEDHIFL